MLRPDVDVYTCNIRRRSDLSTWQRLTALHDGDGKCDVLHTVKHASTMSAIAELEDSLDMLLKVMASAIAYLSRKAAHTQVNPTVPLTTLGNTDAPSFEALQGTRAELVQDIVSQAQDVQLRISNLPTNMLSEDEHVRMIGLTSKRLWRSANSRPNWRRPTANISKHSMKLVCMIVHL